MVITDDVIVLYELKKYMSKYIENFNAFAFSNVIDIFIDRGILVPSIVHGDNETIVRAYKCGEIYRLTTEHFKLFAYMLGHYSKRIDRPLYKIEFEKLCVLFFKKMESEQYLKLVDKENRYRQDENYQKCCVSR